MASKKGNDLHQLAHKEAGRVVADEVFKSNLDRSNPEAQEDEEFENQPAEIP